MSITVYNQKQIDLRNHKDVMLVEPVGDDWQILEHCQRLSARLTLGALA